MTIDPPKKNGTSSVPSTHFALLVDFKFKDVDDTAVAFPTGPLLHKMLLTPEGCAYTSQNVYFFQKEAATVSKLETALHHLAQGKTSKQTLFIYIEGHGRFHPSTRQIELFIPTASEDKTAVDLNSLLHTFSHPNILLILHLFTPSTPKNNQRLTFNPDDAHLSCIVHTHSSSSMSDSQSNWGLGLLSGLRGAGTPSSMKGVDADTLIAYLNSHFSLTYHKRTANFLLAPAHHDDVPIVMDQPDRIPFLARPIFNTLFTGFRKLLLQRAFDRGWSGANVFEIRPFKEGRNASQLNTVIKFGPKEMIEEEWLAYNRWIKGRVPNVAQIIDHPIYDPLDIWGALRYPLVGDGVFNTYSLGERFDALTIDQLAINIPEWVGPSLKQLWENNATENDYTLREGMAFWLPSNLDYEGSQLHETVQQYLPQLSLNDTAVSLTPTLQLPNPLHNLPYLLDKPLRVYKSPIHGDLNLENILVIQTTTNLHVQLIDFARARHDYVMHDMLCLETGVLLNVLPRLLQTHPAPLDCLLRFLVGIHFETTPQQGSTTIEPVLEKPFRFLVAFREMARPFLKQRDDWSNYYKALQLYLLGAIKFRSLAVAAGERPLPREFAFWGAAIVKQLEKESSVFDGLVEKRPFQPPTHSKPIPAHQLPPTLSPKELNSTINTNKFRKLLVTHFSIEDLDELCDEMFIDPEQIEGETLKNRAMNIIKYFKRRVQLGELYEKAKGIRPMADWHTLFE